jgi:hypothetical protein
MKNNFAKKDKNLIKNLNFSNFLFENINKIYDTNFFKEIVKFIQAL